MANSSFTDQELLAYLDELLPVQRMAAVEAALRNSSSLRRRLAHVRRQRDPGEHSVGEIWRRHRLSCLSRQQLGSHLLGTADSALSAYIEFHVHTVGCRFCHANLLDLQQQAQRQPETTHRREKFFQSSAGILPK